MMNNLKSAIKNVDTIFKKTEPSNYHFHNIPLTYFFSYYKKIKNFIFKNFKIFY